MSLLLRAATLLLQASLFRASQNGPLTTTCTSDFIEINLPYDKAVELSSLQYRGCTEAQSVFTQNETDFHVNIKLNIQQCTSLWRSTFQVDHIGTLTLGRQIGMSWNQWILFDEFDFSTYCEFPKFYEVTFGYGSIVIERNDTEVDAGALDLNFTISAFDELYDTKLTYNQLQAGTMINLGFELNNPGLPGCDISYAPMSCEVKAVVDSVPYNYTLYEYNQENCTNDVIDFGIEWDGAKEIWKMKHILFLFGDLREADMRLHCQIAVCKNQDFVDNICNNVANSCMDLAYGGHEFGNPCNLTYTSCLDGSTLVNEPCPIIDHCDPNPCVHADQCNNQPDTYDCGVSDGAGGYTCHTGYEGKDCDIAIDYCAQSICTTPGTDLCENIVGGYECICNSGWMGVDCSEVQVFSSLVTLDATYSTEFNAAEYNDQNISATIQDELLKVLRAQLGSQLVEARNFGHSITCSPLCVDVVTLELVVIADQAAGNSTRKRRGAVAAEPEVPTVSAVQLQLLKDVFASVNGNSGLLAFLKIYMTDIVNNFDSNAFTIDNDACSPNPCQNSRPCADMIDGQKAFEYECDCGDEYTGVDCETQIDHCDGDPCGIDFTCLDGEGKYTCIPDGIVTPSQVADTFQNGWVPEKGTSCRTLDAEARVFKMSWPWGVGVWAWSTELKVELKAWEKGEDLYILHDYGAEKINNIITAQGASSDFHEGMVWKTLLNAEYSTVTSFSVNLIVEAGSLPPLSVTTWFCSPSMVTGDEVDFCAVESACQTGESCANGVSAAVCTDIDECADGTFTCPDGHECSNTHGSYECNDVDECIAEMCGNGFHCTNTVGSYECEAFKECTYTPSVCPKFYTCQEEDGPDQDGGFSCQNTDPMQCGEFATELDHEGNRLDAMLSTSNCCHPDSPCNSGETCTATELPTDFKNAVSSAYVKPGYIMQVYENIDKTGLNWIIDGAVPDLDESRGKFKAYSCYTLESYLDPSDDTWTLYNQAVEERTDAYKQCDELDEKAQLQCKFLLQIKAQWGQDIDSQFEKHPKNCALQFANRRKREVGYQPFSSRWRRGTADEKFDEEGTTYYELDFEVQEYTDINAECIKDIEEDKSEYGKGICQDMKNARQSSMEAAETTHSAEREMANLHEQSADSTRKAAIAKAVGAGVKAVGGVISAVAEYPNPAKMIGGAASTTGDAIMDAADIADDFVQAKIMYKEADQMNKLANAAWKEAQANDLRNKADAYAECVQPGNDQLSCQLDGLDKKMTKMMAGVSKDIQYLIQGQEVMKAKLTEIGLNVATLLAQQAYNIRLDEVQLHILEHPGVYKMHDDINSVYEVWSGSSADVIGLTVGNCQNMHKLGYGYEIQLLDYLNYLSDANGLQFATRPSMTKADVAMLSEKDRDRWAEDYTAEFRKWYRLAEFAVMMRQRYRIYIGEEMDQDIFVNRLQSALNTFKYSVKKIEDQLALGVCQCENGTPPELTYDSDPNDICPPVSLKTAHPDWEFAKCKSCDEGYHLTAEFTCAVNECTCPQHIARTGPGNCKSHRVENCQTCKSADYELVPATGHNEYTGGTYDVLHCKWKECSCSSGTGFKGEECKPGGSGHLTYIESELSKHKHHCKNCDEDYNYNRREYTAGQFACYKASCHCPYGATATNNHKNDVCRGHGSHTCMPHSCFNAHFYHTKTGECSDKTVLVFFDKRDEFGRDSRVAVWTSHMQTGNVEEAGLTRWNTIPSLSDYFDSSWDDEVMSLIIYRGFCVLPYRDEDFGDSFQSDDPVCCDCTDDDIRDTSAFFPSDWAFHIHTLGDAGNVAPNYCVRQFSDTEARTMSSVKVYKCDSHSAP